MSAEKKTRRLPARWTSIPAVIAALLLTGALLITLLGGTGVYLMTNQSLHVRAAQNREAVDLQMQKIRTGMEKLGAEYGFDPEPLIDLIDRDSVEILDQEVAAWWTSVLRTGEMTEKPVYEPEGVEDTLLADQNFIDGLDPMVQATTLSTISRRAGQIVLKSAMLFRDALVQMALSFAGEKVDLPDLMAAMQKVPLIGCAACLLLAGLIALLMSRNLIIAGKYIGASISACGLLWIVVMALTWALNLRGMIAEASAALEIQFASLTQFLTGSGFALAAGLMLLGGVLMALARREYRRYE